MVRHAHEAPQEGAILVTGATSGIGLATVRRLLWDGAGSILATGRDAGRLEALAGELGDAGACVQADLSQLADITRLIAAVTARGQPLRGLVLNAGVSAAPAIGELELTDYDALMDVNVRGVVFTLVRALPLLAPGASVVLVGSVAGRKGQPGDALYAGSKGFVRAFARTLGTSPELAGRGVRVNTVSPGPIRTPLTSAATREPQIVAHVEAMIPLGRWGEAEEVADAIAFLLSPQARFITGADLTVDGGMAHA